jgi:uncharacterized membrane protein YraQ (UPF0718 family)
VISTVAHALLAGLLAAGGFFWDSLFGLIFGFLLSAIAQVVLTPASMHRFLGPNLKGIVFGTGFGIIASACSYGAAAAARGFYQKGADVRAVFAFLISSTNMNVAIVILFWSLLGWKFAFAEFFGGVIIIAVVAAGFTMLVGSTELERLRREHPSPVAPRTGSLVEECPICDMEGEVEHAVEHAGITYWACGAKHETDLRANPGRYLGTGDADLAEQGRASLWQTQTWTAIAEVAMSDVHMLRTELIVGYLVAGYAAALVPQGWLASALHAVGTVPVIGYALLLIVGLLIAVATFVCSMGNVPVARFLANASIPLGANTTFIYGDLLIPPLLAIYRKSFPNRVTWTFVGLFTVGAMIAGAVMQWVIGNELGGASTGSMGTSDRFTLISNALAIGVSLAIALLVASMKRRKNAAGKRYTW